MTEDERTGGFTPKRATKFFIPLLLQAFSQCLTYPLVAAIVAHGELGVGGYTAFAQGQTIMFLIGSVASGLVTTGMVHARTRAGYACFKRLNAVMISSLLAVQLAAALPPLNGYVFEGMLRLPPELASVASATLGWGVLMQAAFLMRNMSTAILFNARASFEANLATMIRLAITVASSPLFIHLGWTGPMWGLVAMTGPCYVECGLTYLFARKYVLELPRRDPDGVRHRVMDQFRFTMPLSLGCVLLAVAPLLVAMFVGRTENAVAMLAIHYVTVGVSNPIAFGALRMQAVAIQFPPEWKGDRRMLGYAASAGLVLGVLSLVFTLRPVANWYFKSVQNVPECDLWRTRVVMGIYALAPFLQALRGRLEGLAACMKRPKAVMAGQMAYVAVFFVALSLGLFLGEPGWLMGVSAILSGIVATIVALHLQIRTKAI